MNSQTSAALIAALSAGGVAVVGFITNLRTTTRTLDAARDQRLWEKRAKVYEEILAFCAYRQMSRQRIISLGDSPDTQAGLQRVLGSYEPPSWFQMQARVIAFGSAEVEQAFRNARDADEACGPYPLRWTPGLAARFVGRARNGFDTPLIYAGVQGALGSFRH